MIPYNFALNTSIDDWSGNGGRFKYFNLRLVYILYKKKKNKCFYRWIVAISKDILGIKQRYYKTVHSSIGGVYSVILIGVNV